jgi:hypothetical protein
MLVIPLPRITVSVEFWEGYAVKRRWEGRVCRLDCRGDVGAVSHPQPSRNNAAEGFLHLIQRLPKADRPLRSNRGDAGRHIGPSCPTERKRELRTTRGGSLPNSLYRLRRSTRGRYRWHAGGRRIALIRSPGRRVGGNHRLYTEDGIPFTSFGVEDVKAEHARLEGLGVKFTQPPTTFGDVTTAAVETHAGT